MDVFRKCYTYTEAEEARKTGVYPYFHEIDSRQHSEVTMDGHRTIMLGSNNYLGLTSDDRVIEAAKKALDRFGSGCSGSRFLNGTLTIHCELECRLAEFFGKEDVITFSTGFQTNLGGISALCGPNDNIYFDDLNHASLRDAAKLSFGKLCKYRHNDLEQLERLLAACPENRGKLIVVDGVFSMEGSLANLPELVRLKKKYGTRLMVDDAHGAGVMGKTGRGSGEHFGLMDEIDLYMSTFSKSFASLGGFLAADFKVIDFIRHHSRPFIFSASMTPSNVGAAMEALEILKSEPERVERLHDNSEYMRRGFRQIGIPAGKSDAPIIPVSTYFDDRTFAITRSLLDHGVYVNPVVSPAVPVGESIIRTSYTATHTHEQLDFALEQFDLVFNKLFPMSDEEAAERRRKVPVGAGVSE